MRILYTCPVNRGEITITKVVYGPVVISNYGYLYNWYVTPNIANDGWHIPTREDFVDFIEYLGGIIENTYYITTPNTIAYDLMESGTTYWTTGGNNSTSFNGRGSGIRGATNGICGSLNSFSRFWVYYDGVSIAEIFELSSTGILYNNIIGGNTLNSGYSIRLLCDSSTDPGFYDGNDGKRYSTVKIGDQVWLAESLMETKYNDGSDIPEVTGNAEWVALSTGARCSYSNTESNAGSTELEIRTNDTTEFPIIITGQGTNPHIRIGNVTQQTPLVVTKLKYDTYIITEDTVTDYTLTSIVEDEIILDKNNKSAEVEITNEYTP